MSSVCQTGRFSTTHLQLRARRIFKIGVDSLLGVEVISLFDAGISWCQRGRSESVADLEEADSLFARRAGEADEIRDGVLGRFSSHDCSIEASRPVRSSSLALLNEQSNKLVVCTSVAVPHHMTPSAVPLSPSNPAFPLQESSPQSLHLKEGLCLQGNTLNSGLRTYLPGNLLSYEPLFMNKYWHVLNDGFQQLIART